MREWSGRRLGILENYKYKFILTILTYSKVPYVRDRTRQFTRTDRHPGESSETARYQAGLTVDANRAAGRTPPEARRGIGQCIDRKQPRGCRLAGISGAVHERDLG